MLRFFVRMLRLGAAALLLFMLALQLCSPGSHVSQAPNDYQQSLNDSLTSVVDNTIDKP